MKKLLVLGLAAVSASGFSAPYILDDGTGEDSIGLTAGGTIVWGNLFTAAAGNNLITSIDVAWGVVPNGTATTAFLWSDPNGDGNPGDAVVLASLAGTVANTDTDTFNNFNIADTVVAPGSNFFVGFVITHAQGAFPARIDQTDPDVPGRSWIGIGNSWAAAGANIFTTEGVGLPGNWMVRANAAPVPEPATMAILGLGGLALIRRRRNAR